MREPAHRLSFTLVVIARPFPFVSVATDPSRALPFRGTFRTRRATTSRLGMGSRCGPQSPHGLHPVAAIAVPPTFSRARRSLSGTPLGAVSSHPTHLRCPSNRGQRSRRPPNFPFGYNGLVNSCKSVAPVPPGELRPRSGHSLPCPEPVANPPADGSGDGCASRSGTGAAPHGLVFTSG